MLKIWVPGTSPDSSPPSEDRGRCITGLHEDTDYFLTWEGRLPGDRLFIDDVEFAVCGNAPCRWRPEFYAGRVRLEIARAGTRLCQVWLVVGAAKLKATAAGFEHMVRQIREFDPALLLGEAAATSLFGRHGSVSGRFNDAILLGRMREYGEDFIQAVAHLVREPHRALTQIPETMPLARARRISSSTLRERRVALLVAGHAPQYAAHSTFIRGRSCTMTVDTPANRAVMALIHRFLAQVRRLIVLVSASDLKGDREFNDARRSYRKAFLNLLEERASKLASSAPFCDVTPGLATAAGFTQIAASPSYSRAYSLGCRALDNGIEGEDASNSLNTAHSWGVYETWCYLSVIQGLMAAGGRVEPLCASHRPSVSSELGHRVTWKAGAELHTHFQARFRAVKPAAGYAGHSISRERRPDIIVERRDKDKLDWLVLDAKWRSGRSAVLESMESAHIYHDSLRIGATPPSVVLLLLPGNSRILSLDDPNFWVQHGVGTVSKFNVASTGLEVIATRMNRFRIDGSL